MPPFRLLLGPALLVGVNKPKPAEFIQGNLPPGTVGFLAGSMLFDAVS
jgi:hypothetical protein